ncbi:hypothetical protein ACFLQN_04925, partial [Candidatus Aenigmatarchaeota archaeon]
MSSNEFEKYQVIIQELVRRTNDTNLRLRGVEQRVQSLEERTNVIEENTMQKMKKINDKFFDLDASFRNLNDEISIVKNTLEKINRQITKVAFKKDVKEVERMFDLLSPVKNEFVTRD